MATQQTARISIQNNTGGTATFVLIHNNSSNGTQWARMSAGPGQVAGTLTVNFETGLGSQTVLDYWSVMAHVEDGPSAGLYATTGWKECQLQSPDAGQSMTFPVSPTGMTISLKSGPCNASLQKLAPYAPISHVFVVMLENHSFDNVFALTGLPGITAATAANSNAYGGKTYHVYSPMLSSMTTDPGHEFNDVLEQLAGQGASYPPGGPYPDVDMSGFAANYATSTTEGPAPAPADIGDIMACGYDPDGSLMFLAKHFVVCDNWFSSMPGPTWPNRFFVHGASSSGLDDSPSTAQMKTWETTAGFQYPNGSIYNKLSNAGIPYRFYSDYSTLWFSLYSNCSSPQAKTVSGAIPQVASLQGINFATDFSSLSQFASDLQGPYPYPYTFIEPHYGDIYDNTYVCGSSQHPMDDVYGGDQLLYHVYQAICQSPYWQSSLLIVIYDEHGGFYDSVGPPGGTPATPPGDNPNYGYNTHGFNFDLLGARVPAVVVSPLVASGTVDHTVYDHSSVLKTLEEMWGLSALTKRDAAATGLTHLLSASSASQVGPMPAPALRPAPGKPPLTEAEQATIQAGPVPARGNLAAALYTARKIDAELSGEAGAADVATRFAAVRTRGDAGTYIGEVLAKVAAARSQGQPAAAPSGGTAGVTR